MTVRRRSGIQHVLRHGELEATIASVGASLRSLTAAGRDLVVPFDADEIRPAYRGATLVPWPNRIVDGRHAFDGTERRLPLTEPERGHALHGLAAWLDWEAVDASATSVRLAVVVEASLGFPWRLRIETTYALDDAGLTQTVEATSLDDRPAPWGAAPHPYLVAGVSPLDAWSLELPAERVLLVTPDRLAPTTLEPVEVDAHRFDFRAPRTIGAVAIDHAYTGIGREVDGLARVRLRDPEGGGVEMAFDASCEWLQIHTADLPGGPSQAGHRAGLAVEPMTCAPDAINRDRYPFETGLVVLEPGATHAASWSIRPLRA